MLNGQNLNINTINLNDQIKKAQQQVPPTVAPKKDYNQIKNPHQIQRKIEQQ